MTDQAGKDTSKEQKRKEMIRNTFEAVANAYGLGGARFFYSAGEYMAATPVLKGHENVLDVASGTGSTALPLARRLPQGKVIAVDFSPAMLAESKARAAKAGLNNIDYLVHDMTEMPFPEEVFDCATCSFGLFFVDDMRALLAHIASKVKSGGSITVSGFCGESFMPQVELLFSRLKIYGIDLPEQPSAWKRMAEPDQLHALFVSAGLGDVAIKRESLGYYVDAQGWWDVVWNAGFRGLVAQLGDQLEVFKKEHFAELESLMTTQGMKLEIDVNFTQGFK